MRLSKLNVPHVCAHLVVEVMELGVALLADVAVLWIGGLPEVGIVDVALLEFGWQFRIRRREHGLGPQRPDSGLVECVLIALPFGGAASHRAGLELQPALGGIGFEQIAGGVDEVGPLLRRQHTE